MTNKIINLYTIFRYLIKDQNFLLTIIEDNQIKVPMKENDDNIKFDLTKNIINEYVQLEPYEKQEYSTFPEKAKELFLPSFIRFGIKHIIEKNVNIINISFLSMNMDEQIQSYSLLEDFIIHRIHRNYQIDKIKNTKKVKIFNNGLIDELRHGKISSELIQTITGIFEINLIIIDFNKSEIIFFWAKGSKYPYLNLFNQIYYMALIQGNYEPILSNIPLNKEQKQKMYLYILENSSQIKLVSNIKLSIPTLYQLNQWNIPVKIYVNIIEKYYKKQ